MKDQNKIDPGKETCPPPPTQGRTNRQVATIDVDYYNQYLTDHDLSEDEKRELILAIANIMIAFVDLGFDLAPGGLACGEDVNVSDLFTSKAGNPLYSEQFTSAEITEYAADLMMVEGSES